MTQLAQTVDPAPLLPAQIGDYRAIPIAAIRIGPRLRYLRSDAVSNLANNIAEHGLHVAISVAEEAADDGTTKFLLIDGAHRLKACKQIGWEQVPARVYRLDEIERQILEIDVNLCREELTELERGEHLLKRKELYEQLHPETRQHLAGAMAANAVMGRGDASANLALASFTRDAAEKTRRSLRAVQRSIARIQKIDPEIRDRIRDKPVMANNGTELDALASLNPDQQLRAVEMVETQGYKTIRAAKKKLHDAVSPAPEKPVKSATFSTTRRTPLPDIPNSQLDAATSDLGKQDSIRKLRQIVDRVEGTDRNNLIALLCKLGSTHCDKLAACLL